MLLWFLLGRRGKGWQIFILGVIRDTILYIVAVYLERLTLENMYILKHNFIWNTRIYLAKIQLLFLSRRTFYT